MKYAGILPHLKRVVALSSRKRPLFEPSEGEPYDFGNLIGLGEISSLFSSRCNELAMPSPSVDASLGWGSPIPGSPQDTSFHSPQLGSPVRPSTPEIRRTSLSSVKSTSRVDESVYIELGDSTSISIRGNWAQSRSKKVASAIYTSGYTQSPCVAIKSRSQPRELDDLAIRLGILTTFELDGEFVQVSKRGVPLSTVKKWLDLQPESPADKDVFMVAQLRSALTQLAAIHSAGFAHMDIKPENLVSYGLSAGVIDCDQLPRIDSKDSYSSDINFASPRKVSRVSLELRYPSHQSDVYSLGKTLRQLLTPGGEVLARLDPFIQTMTDSERSQRPSLAEVIQNLDMAIAGYPLSDPLAQRLCSDHPHVFDLACADFFKPIIDISDTSGWS